MIPIWMESHEYIDNMFITCCIFHNMIMIWDGTDTSFEDHSTWQTCRSRGRNQDSGDDVVGESDGVR